MMAKPPWAATQVVKASARLHPTHKLVWLELYALDQQEGAWVSGSVLAARLGVSDRTVKRARLALLEARMLVAERGRRRTATWRAVLPSGVGPLADRLPFPSVQSLARALDDHLAHAGYRADSGGWTGDTHDTDPVGATGDRDGTIPPATGDTRGSVNGDRRVPATGDTRGTAEGVERGGEVLPLPIPSSTPSPLPPSPARAVARAEGAAGRSRSEEGEAGPRASFPPEWEHQLRALRGSA